MERGQLLDNQQHCGGSLNVQLHFCLILILLLQWAIKSSFAVSTVGDLAIAAAMVYYLLKGRSNFARYVLSTMVLRTHFTAYFSTNSKLASLIQYSLGSGIATRSV